MNKLNKNVIKYIAYSVLGVFIILYFVINVIKMNSDPYKTEVALVEDVQRTVETTAFAVRDEAYITADSSNGTMVSVADDGKRVAEGDTVAVVFNSASSAVAYARINEIEDEISYYSQLKNRVGLGTNAPSAYSSVIDSACLDYITASRNEINSDFNEALTDLRDAVTAKQLAVGTQLTVDSKLAELQQELSVLQSQSMGYSVVTSPNPGYYIGSVDGYEEILKYSDVLDVNTEKIQNLLASQKQPVPNNVMGKLVDAFDWYLLCNIPYNSSGDLEEGGTVKVNFPDSSVGTITCTVAFKGNREGDSVALVLRCNAMNPEVANLRIENIQIIVDEYKGIKIDNKAIREQDGEKGVYILYGNIVKFKKINILYSTEEYSIIERVTDDSSYVRQYDTIINEGVELYDGKVIS